jgi:iron complex outermembrane receptor protein
LAILFEGRSRRRPGLTLMAVLMASAAPAAVFAQSAGASAPAAENPSVVQEIIVTAEKRSGTVQSTPISMTALSGSQLQAQGVTNLQDIIKTIPGISERTSGPGQTELELRGLASSGGSVPTVGYYLDETPMSPPANSLNGKVVIDPDLYDLDRVEVLRGPQGTLYGSGSMGGTIKLITNQPDPSHFYGSYDATLSGTPSSGGVNGGGDLMVNIPLVTDKVALRVVGTEKYTDGWIDRIVGGPDFPLETNPCPQAPTFFGCTRGNVADTPVTQVIKNTNSSLVQAARASLLADLTPKFSIEASFLYQRTTADGYSEYDNPPGPNPVEAHYQPFNIPEPFEDTIGLGSIVMKYDLGGVAQITSSTSYWSRVESQTQDVSEALQNVLDIDFYTPITFTERDQSHQISEELRATSEGAGPFQWVTGVFYSSLKSSLIDTNASPALAFLSNGGAAANPDGVVYSSNNPYRLNQYAVFGEASYSFLEHLKATVGLRYFDYDTRQDATEFGIVTLSGNTTPFTNSTTSSASGLNPKFNLSYIPGPDLTVYASISKGFRPGGINLPAPPALCPGQPATYGPDSVWTYELGEKAKLLDGHLQVNGDVYFTQWQNVQQLISPACGYQYTTNAGSAEAYGPELEMAAHFDSHWSMTVNGAYTSAKLTSVEAGAGLSVGQPILNIPDYTASTTLMYRHEIFDDMMFVGRVSDSYTGSSFDQAFFVEKLQPYNIVDLRFTVSKAARSLTLFVANATNERAELSVNNTSFSWSAPSIERVSTNQPRTIGLTFANKF